MAWDSTFDKDEAEYLVQAYLEKHANCKSNSVKFTSDSGKKGNVKYLSNSSSQTKTATCYFNMTEVGTYAPILFHHDAGTVKVTFKEMVSDIYSSEVNQHGGFNGFIKHRKDLKDGVFAQSPEELAAIEADKERRAKELKEKQAEAQKQAERTELSLNMTSVVASATAQLLYKQAKQQDNPIYHQRQPISNIDHHSYLTKKEFILNKDTDGFLLSPQKTISLTELTQFIKSDEFRIPKELVPYFERKKLGNTEIAEINVRDDHELPQRIKEHHAQIQLNNSIKAKYNLPNESIQRSETYLKDLLKLKGESPENASIIAKSLKSESANEPNSYFNLTTNSGVVRKAIQQGDALIPFRDSNGVTTSLQFISHKSTGEKSFLPGGIIGGSGFVFGAEKIPKDNQPKMIIGGEGWATCKEISDFIQEEAKKRPLKKPIYVIEAGSANTMNKLFSEYLDPAYNANQLYLVDNDTKKLSQLKQKLVTGELNKERDLSRIQSTANVGLKTAIEYVAENPERSNRISLIIPKFNYKGDNSGSDWNDVRLLHGRSAFNEAFKAEILEAIERSKAKVNELERAIPLYNEQVSYFAQQCNLEIKGINPEKVDEPILLSGKDFIKYSNSLTQYAEKFNVQIYDSKIDNVATTDPTEPQTPATQEKVKPIAENQVETVVETPKADVVPTVKTPSNPIVESKEAAPIEPPVEVSNSTIESKSERKKKFQNVFSNIEKSVDSEVYKDKPWFKAAEAYNETYVASLAEDIQTPSSEISHQEPPKHQREHIELNTFAYTLAIVGEHVAQTVELKSQEVKGEIVNENELKANILYQVLLDQTMAKHAQKIILDRVKNSLDDSNTSSKQRSLEKLARLCEPGLIQHTQDIHHEYAQAQSIIIKNKVSQDASLQSDPMLIETLGKEVNSCFKKSSIEEKRSTFREFKKLLKEENSQEWIDQTIKKIEELQQKTLQNTKSISFDPNHDQDHNLAAKNQFNFDQTN